MPELPEVETIRQQLAEELPFTILKVDYSPVFNSLVGQKEFEILPKEVVSEIKRKGKLLQFCLKRAKFLFSHLGMSGGWRISLTPIVEKHTHLHFKIQTAKGQKYLGYVDPRRFGQLVTRCGRICEAGLKVSLSSAFAGQEVGIKEVEDGIWVVSFLEYDPGYFDEDNSRIEPVEDPFNKKVLPMSPV